jgi:hypothetical protein
MDDLMIACLAFGLRHFPFGRRGGHEHRLGGRAGPAERLEEVADRARTVGVLVAVTRVADRLLDGDPAPIGLQLVGGHLRQRRPDAGPHLGTVRDDEDGAVGADAEVDARIERRRLGLRAERRRLGPDGLGQHLGRDDEGAGRRDPLQEVPAADILDRAHARPPFAAVLIAARMR